jgi:two-component system response regulator (stage 0 sporulation protein A)
MKVLVADSLEEFRSALAALLQSDNQIQIAADGVQTLQLLGSFHPDILVLDLMLPGLDGISLMQKAVELGISPKILATTRFMSDYIQFACEKLPVSYLMVKPCDIHAAAARVRDIAGQTDATPSVSSSPKAHLTAILLQLGISPRISGYEYLREAILIMMRTPGISLTKELYPAVASQCSADAEQVERSIRTAIQTAWKRRDDALWQQYLPACGGSVPRPANSVFLRRFADYMAMNCEE